MALPSTGYATATVTNPSAALTDFSLLIDLSRMPAEWTAAIDTADYTKGRAAKDAGETELACDWIGTGWLRVKWSGTLASTGTQVLRIYPPVAANASVAASDTYGSDNAYNVACLAYVPMHEASGNAADRTATGATCTLDAEAYGVAGQAGPAVEFDGTADDGSLPVNLSGINKVIVECWLYWDAYATDNDLALEYTANISTTGAFQLNPNAATSTLDFTHKTSSGYYSRRYTRPTAAAWHHYAAVIDRPNGVSLYIDGSLATPASTPLTSTESGNFPNSALKLMSRNGAALFGAGRMQHLSLWSARTADEIATEFAQSSDQAAFWGTPAWEAAGGSVVVVSASLAMEVYDTADEDTNLIAFKFALPSIVGTVTGARLYLATSAKAATPNANYASKTSADATWTSGSSGATIAGLSMTAAIETVNAAAVSAVDGNWNSWDVFTTGANSIANAYAGTPGDFTVVLDSDFTALTGSTQQETVVITFAEDGDNTQVDFHGPSASNSALRPYLEITYTADAGGDTAQFMPFF